jgi:glycosyltransferase involved in cell wall biosynthesis
LSRLGVVGTTVYPAVLDPSAGDVQTWARVSEYFDQIVVIAQAASIRPRRERVGRVTYVLLPQLPRPVNLVAFPFQATLLAVGAYLRGFHTWSFSDPLRSGVVFLALRLFPRTRLVVHIQGQLLRMPSARFGRTTWLVERFSRFVARRADLVRVVSAQIANEAVALGVRRDRITVIASRCDTEFFDPDRWEEGGQELRSQLPGDASAPVIGFLGSFNASKGLDVLTSACTLVRQRQPVRLVLAGDGPLRPEVELSAAHSTYPVVLLGRLEAPDVARFLAMIDVLAAPSHDEGLPRAVLEAMAMRVPVVASRVGGTPEAVEDGVSGLLVPPGDPFGLAEGINRVLDDDILAAQLGEAARQRVVNGFDAKPGWRRLAALHLPQGALREP